jgi:hypothetical protein
MASQWSELEARSFLRAWSASGLSIEKFATQRGITPQRLRWWKKKLEGSGPAIEGKGLSLLPVHVADSGRGAPIQVLLPNGHIVRVGRGFDEEAFSRVIALLGAR